MVQSSERKVGMSYLLPLWEPDLWCSFEPVEIRQQSRPTLPQQSLIQDSFYQGHLLCILGIKETKEIKHISLVLS